MANKDKYVDYLERARDACKAIHEKYDYDAFSRNFICEMLDQLEPLIDEGERLLNDNLMECNTLDYWHAQTGVLAMSEYRAELVYQLAELN